MTWTIENYSGPLASVMVGRADKRHGMQWRVHRHTRMTLQSMSRVCKVAQKYATRIRLQAEGWTASGEDEVLR